MINRIIDQVVASRFVLFAGVAAVITALSPITLHFLGIYDLSPLNFVDTAILLSLAFGVYLKKSRTCAIILLVWHLGARVDMYERTGSYYGAFGPIAISIAWIYILGILGTLVLHTDKQKASSTVSDLPPEPLSHETRS